MNRDKENTFDAGSILARSLEKSKTSGSLSARTYSYSNKKMSPRKSGFLIRIHATNYSHKIENINLVSIILLVHIKSAQ